LSLNHVIAGVDLSASFIAQLAYKVGSVLQVPVFASAQHPVSGVIIVDIDLDSSKR